MEAARSLGATGPRLLIRHCRHGVHLVQRNRNVVVADCHVYENRGVGIFLDAVNLHQINVTGCHVSYNDGGGIVVRAGEVPEAPPAARPSGIGGGARACDVRAFSGEVPKGRPPHTPLWHQHARGSEVRRGF